MLSTGIPAEFLEPILDQITDLGFWGAEADAAYIMNLAREGLDSSSSFEGVAGATKMRRGTGAGNPIADILFLLAFTKIIQFLRLRLKAAGLDISVPCAGADAFFGWGEVCVVPTQSACRMYHMRMIWHPP